MKPTPKQVAQSLRNLDIGDEIFSFIDDIDADVKVHVIVQKSTKVEVLVEAEKGGE